MRAEWKISLEIEMRSVLSPPRERGFGIAHSASATWTAYIN